MEEYIRALSVLLRCLRLNILDVLGVSGDLKMFAGQ